MTTPTVLTRIARRAGRPGAARAPRVQRGAVISIRYAGRDEEAAIERLAELSERPVPLGSALVAEVDGELWAALPLATGTLLVDPFHPSAEVEQLLTLRAAQIAAA
ncbi:MAG TPA: hypothetical protein VGF46_07305 [Gaiellales bacterium]